MIVVICYNSHRKVTWVASLPQKWYLIFKRAQGLLWAEVPILSPTLIFLHLSVQIWSSYLGVKTWPGRACPYQLQFLRRGGHCEQDSLYSTFPSLWSSFLSLSCDWQCIRTDQPSLCEMRSARPHRRADPGKTVHKLTNLSKLTKSRGEIKNLENQSPSVAILQVEMIMEMKCCRYKQVSRS